MRLTSPWPNVTEGETTAVHVLYLAKHALSGDEARSLDGSHSTYHRQIRSRLEECGFRVTSSNDALAATSSKGIDFVFSLMNRLGFRNSEVLVAALCENARVPYLGSSPAIRALADDKHFAKRIFKSVGATTPRWQTRRVGDNVSFALPTVDLGYVVKPLGSSASWGMSFQPTPGEAKAAVEGLISAGIDAIVEEFIPGRNLTLPVFGTAGPEWLSVVEEVADAPDNMITYESKRGFASPCRRRICHDARIRAVVYEIAERVLPEFTPFDYGRLDFRLDERTNVLYLLELNISCNLRQGKAIAMAAEYAGISHKRLIGGLVLRSIARQRTEHFGQTY